MRAGVRAAVRDRALAASAPGRRRRRRRRGRAVDLGRISAERPWPSVKRFAQPPPARRPVARPPSWLLQGAQARPPHDRIRPAPSPPHVPRCGYAYGRGARRGRKAALRASLARRCPRFRPPPPLTSQLLGRVSGGPFAGGPKPTLFSAPGPCPAGGARDQASGRRDRASRPLRCTGWGRAFLPGRRRRRFPWRSDSSRRARPRRRALPFPARSRRARRDRYSDSYVSSALPSSVDWAERPARITMRRRPSDSGRSWPYVRRPSRPSYDRTNGTCLRSSFSSSSQSPLCENFPQYRRSLRPHVP